MVDKGWPLYPDEIGRYIGGIMSRDTIRNYNHLSSNEEYLEEENEVKSTGLKIVRFPDEQTSTVYEVIEEDYRAVVVIGIFSTREKACVARGKWIKYYAEIIAHDAEQLAEIMTNVGKRVFIRTVTIDKESWGG